MPSFLPKKCFHLILLCLFQALTGFNAMAQESEKSVKAAERSVVFEIKNFSEGKTLPAMNSVLNQKKGIRIEGYCVDQSLVSFSYNPEIFHVVDDIIALLEDNGYIAYQKEGLTISDAENICKRPFTKLKKSE